MTAKKPALTPVTSSNIDAVGFDARGLLVRFKGGTLYAYPDAKKALFTQMLAAESVGGFFASNVRGKLVHRLVADE